MLLDEPGDHARALAGLSVADAVLVNSTCDGLNLVAKEAVIAGGGTGRLVLSETTGAYEQIGRWTHRIHPSDIDETAEALRDARANAVPPELHATWRRTHRRTGYAATSPPCPADRVALSSSSAAAMPGTVGVS